MSGFLTEEQIADHLLTAFEDYAAAEISIAAPQISSDGTTNEVWMSGFFDLDDIAERLRERLVVTELPARRTPPAIRTGYVDWVIADDYTLTTCHDANLLALGREDAEVYLTADEAIYLAARLIDAAHVLNHPAFVNRRQS